MQATLKIGALHPSMFTVVCKNVANQFDYDRNRQIKI